MSNTQKDFTGLVLIIQRLKNTRNGNARFSALCVSDGEMVTFQTRGDTSDAICLQNLDNKRATVSLKQNKRGRWMLQDINAAE